MLSQILLAAMALTANPGTTAPPAAAATAPVKEKKICRMSDPIVGTRIGGPRRVCRTQRAWDNEEAETQRLVRGVGDATGPQLCAPGNGDCGGAASNPPN